MRDLISLLLSCVKIGAFTFGGGAAMIALLENELVTRRKWITPQDLLDFFAIAQCTPGIIAVNTATIVGYKLKGWVGALIATLGVVLPSICIIILIASLLQGFMDNEYVVHVFNGIRVAVVAIIANIFISLWQKTIKHRWEMIVFAISILELLLFLLSPAVVVVVGLALGGVRQGFLFFRRREK